MLIMVQIGIFHYKTNQYKELKHLQGKNNFFLGNYQETQLIHCNLCVVMLLGKFLSNFH